MFGIYSRVRRGLDRWFRASVPSNLVAPMSIGAQSRAPELAPLPVSEPAAVEEYWMCITAPCRSKPVRSISCTVPASCIICPIWT